MYKENPFGNPDGARANLQEIEASFITDFPYGLRISKDPSFLSKRFFIGAKGSGKTVYLKKLQSILKKKLDDQPGVIYVDDEINLNLECTEFVIRFCDLFERRETLSEKWNGIWQLAIFTAVAHKFLFVERLKNYPTKEQSAQLRDLLCSMELFLETNVSVYQSVRTLLYVCDTQYKTNRLLFSKYLVQLRSLLNQILRNAPPIYIFLDTVDLEFENAPLHWLLCQKGLFYSVMSLLEENVFGDRLHIVVCVRDIVFNNILSSEHVTKFATESHVFLLLWNEGNIRDFISQKIQRLSDCYFINDISYIVPHKRTINDWLGVDTLEVNGREEKVLDFIVSHSRLVPRDIINILNKLSTLKLEKSNNSALQTEKWIVNTVANESLAIGGEMITTCEKSIMANGIPIKAGQNGYADYYLADKYYQKSVSDKLLEVLKLIKNQMISPAILQSVQDKANEVFEHDVHILETLWHCGIVGYIDADGKTKYYAQDFRGDTRFPSGEKQYVFHTCAAIKLGIPLQGEKQ